MTLLLVRLLTRVLSYRVSNILHRQLILTQCKYKIIVFYALVRTLNVKKQTQAYYIHTYCNEFVSSLSSIESLQVL